MRDLMKFTALHTTKIKPLDVDRSGIPIFADLTLLKSHKDHWRGKQDHSRWLYEDRKTNRIFKVWNHSYVRRDNLLMALKAGFYDGLIPAFEGLIFQDGVCMGYVMKKCKRHPESDRLEKQIGKTIVERTQRTQLFAYDFGKEKIYEFNGKPCLIDLEGVYRLDEYRDREKEHEQLIGGKFIRYGNYKDFLKELIDV